jgi:hypothetical protein
VDQYNIDAGFIVHDIDTRCTSAAMFESQRVFHLLTLITIRTGHMSTQGTPTLLSVEYSCR